MPDNPITAGSDSYSGTTTANTVDVVTLDRAYGTVEIASRGTTDLWVTVDRGPASARASVTPSVGGAGVKWIGAGGVRTILGETLILVAGQTRTVPASTVRLMSTTPCAYSIVGG